MHLRLIALSPRKLGKITRFSNKSHHHAYLHQKDYKCGQLTLVVLNLLCVIKDHPLYVMQYVL